MNHSHMYRDFNTIRVKFGDAPLKAAFDQLLQNNTSHAVALLNQQNLPFPTFYLLMPQLLAHGLNNYLNPNYQFALAFSADNPPSIDDTVKKQYLKWMLLSSIHEELDDDDFQDIIDRVIIQLLAVFNEQSLLPPVINLIFTRNRNNQCIYDICWAIFQCNTVSTMSLIAEYLKSGHSQDNKLAYKLLNFKPERQPKNRNQQYANFCKWFTENKDFLYFNNETMQETSQPKYFRVNLPAKYLCKSHASEDSLSDDEREHVRSFHHLDRKTQKLLSKYSYQTHSQDPKAWQDWMNSSISMQCDICKKAMRDRYKT